MTKVAFDTDCFQHFGKSTELHIVKKPIQLVCQFKSNFAMNIFAHNNRNLQQFMVGVEKRYAISVLPYYYINLPGFTSIGPLLWQAQQTMFSPCQLQPAT